MDTYEELTYIPRLAVILFSTLILVTIFAFATPDLPNTNHLRADAYQASIAHNGGFWEQPGVVDPIRFTQETADKYLLTDANEPLPVFVNATLYADGERLRGPITYNTRVQPVIGPLEGISGVTKETTQLPVAIDAGGIRQPGELVLEAYYEN